MKSITIELKGSITIGQGDIKLKKGIRDVFEQGYQLVILDFYGVNYLDSSGLGELVAASQYLKERDGILAIVRVPKKIKKLLYVSLLIEKLNCFNTRDEAVEKLRASLV